MKRLSFAFFELSGNKMIVIELVFLLLLALECCELILFKVLVRISFICLGLATFLVINIVLLLKWANFLPWNFILFAIVGNALEVLFVVILFILVTEVINVCSLVVLSLDVLRNSVFCLSDFNVFHHWNCGKCRALVFVKLQFSTPEIVLAVICFSW